MSGQITTAPPPVDHLSALIERARARLTDPNASPGQRLRLFWAYARAGRHLAASDVFEGEFRRLAADVGLDRERGIGADGIDHVVRWAWLDRNPFGGDT